MCVCEGAVIGPLDATYRILVRERKKLLPEIDATQTRVSVDHLKPHVGVKWQASRHHMDARASYSCK